jgi:hypothetical protein
VVWNIFFIFPNRWDDDPIWRTPSFFRGVGQPPISYPSVVSTACWVNSSPKVLKETCFPNVILRRAAHKTNIFLYHFFSRYFQINYKKAGAIRLGPWRWTWVSLCPVGLTSIPWSRNSLSWTPKVWRCGVCGLTDSANYSDRLIWMGGLMGTNPPRQNRGSSPTTCI